MLNRSEIALKKLLTKFFNWNHLIGFCYWKHWKNMLKNWLNTEKHWKTLKQNTQNISNCNVATNCYKIALKFYFFHFFFQCFSVFFSRLSVFFSSIQCFSVFFSVFAIFKGLPWKQIKNVHWKKLKQTEMYWNVIQKCAKNCTTWPLFSRKTLKKTEKVWNTLKPLKYTEILKLKNHSKPESLLVVMTTTLQWGRWD